MTNDEAMSLARSMRKIEDGSLNLYEHKVNLLCGHILSGSRKREIENAAYERALAAIRTFAAARRNAADRSWGVIQMLTGQEAATAEGLANVVAALVQLPAQKENGE